MFKLTVGLILGALVGIVVGDGVGVESSRREAREHCMTTYASPTGDICVVPHDMDGRILVTQ